MPLCRADEFGEVLSVFGTKLRHMRADIGAIERANNALELTARNNAALQRCLKVQTDMCCRRAQSADIAHIRRLFSPLWPPWLALMPLMCQN
jgi:hypothetical protein